MTRRKHVLMKACNFQVSVATTFHVLFLCSNLERKITKQEGESILVDVMSDIKCGVTVEKSSATEIYKLICAFNTLPINVIIKIVTSYTKNSGLDGIYLLSDFV